MLNNYSLLCGVVLEHLEEEIRKTRTHYNFLVSANGLNYQVNIDVQSGVNPNVKSYFINGFTGHILSSLAKLENEGLTSLTQLSIECRLDYLRSNLFPVDVWDTIPPLSAAEHIESLSNLVMPGDKICIFGEYYDDSQERPVTPYGLELKKVHDKLPSRGMHDTHMNQGTNYDDYRRDKNGIYQDGAILMMRPGRVDALFFVFAGQCLRTDPQGDCIETTN